MPEAPDPTIVLHVSLSFRLLEKSQNCNAAPQPSLRSRLVAGARLCFIHLEIPGSNPALSTRETLSGSLWSQWVLRPLTVTTHV